jgi:hypothetical protein
MSPLARALPALLLAACAGALPAHLADPRAHPSYPPSRFLTAVGRSPRSAAEAEADARRVIVERIRAEIVSLSESMEREQRDGDQVTSSASYLVSVRTKARFSHGELIRIDQSLSARHDGQEHAFAYAEIAELVRVLGQEYETEAAAFRSAVRAAEAAADLPAFAAAYQEAQRRYASLAPKAFELRAVAQKEHGPFASDTQLHWRLLEQRRQRLSATRVSAQVEVSDADTAKLEGLVTRALAGLGVTATVGACTEGLALKVAAAPACGRGSFGHRCTLSLSGALGPCGAQQVWTEADLSDPSFKGASPKGEPEARAIMWTNVTADALATRLRAGLGAALPLE